MLAGSLAFFAATYGIGVAHVWRNAGVGRGISYLQLGAFAAGWFALAVALVSPLDEWADTLFVAHMVQHELLMVVAAPLIAFSSPMVALLWALPRSLRHRVVDIAHSPAIAVSWGTITAPATVWLLHGLTLWLWHLPSLFDAALEHEGIHAVQHLTFYLTAALFWWSLLHGRYGRSGYGVAVLYLFATGLHSGVLGALLALSPDVWYPAYASMNTRWGYTAVEDQQLAGLVMWIPAGLIFVIGGLAFFAGWLQESERRAGARAPR
jgi:putative membrane protein